MTNVEKTTTKNAAPAAERGLQPPWLRALSEGIARLKAKRAPKAAPPPPTPEEIHSGTIPGQETVLEDLREIDRLLKENTKPWPPEEEWPPPKPPTP